MWISGPPMPFLDVKQEPGHLPAYQPTQLQEEEKFLFLNAI